MRVRTGLESSRRQVPSVLVFLVGIHIHADSRCNASFPPPVHCVSMHSVHSSTPSSPIRRLQAYNLVVYCRALRRYFLPLAPSKGLLFFFYFHFDNRIYPFTTQSFPFFRRISDPADEVSTHLAPPLMPSLLGCYHTMWSALLPSSASICVDCCYHLSAYLLYPMMLLCTLRIT